MLRKIAGITHLFPTSIYCRVRGKYGRENICWVLNLRLFHSQRLTPFFIFLHTQVDITHEKLAFKDECCRITTLAEIPHGYTNRQRYVNAVKQKQAKRQRSHRLLANKLASLQAPDCVTRSRYPFATTINLITTRRSQSGLLSYIQNHLLRYLYVTRPRCLQKAGARR